MAQTSRDSNKRSNGGRLKLVDSFLEHLSNFEQKAPALLKVLQAAFITVAGYVTVRYLSSLVYRRYKGYPAGPFCFPLVGNGSSLFSHKFLVQTCGTYGALTYCKLYNQNIIYINESRAAKRFLFNRKDLQNRYQIFSDPKNKISQQMSSGDVRSISFISTNGPDWKVRRQYAMVSLVRFCDSQFMSRVVHGAMHKEAFAKLDKLCQACQEQGSDDANVWHPSELLYYIAFNTVYHANFGHCLDSSDTTMWALKQNITDMSVVFKDIQLPRQVRSAYNVYKYLLYPRTIRNFEKIAAKRKELYVKILEQRREHFRQHPEKLEQIEKNENRKYSLCYIDYLIYLLDYKLKSEKSVGKANARSETADLNDLKVINDLSLMFFAGTDTTANTLHFAVYLLAKSPDLQEQLLRCLKSALGANGMNPRGRLELAQVMGCADFKAFVYESLRISSVVPTTLSHTVNKDTEVNIDNKKYVLPGDSIITINIDYIHRGQSTKEHWKNKQFGLGMDDVCLDNWIAEENGQRKFVMNESFVSFGTGARDCPGQQLSLKEMHLVIAYLILNYKLSIPSSVDVEKFEIKRNFGVIVSTTNQEGVCVEQR